MSYLLEDNTADRDSINVILSYLDSEEEAAQHLLLNLDTTDKSEWTSDFVSRTEADMMTTLESLFAKTHDSRVYTIKKKLHLMYKEILEELLAKELAESEELANETRKSERIKDKAAAAAAAAETEPKVNSERKKRKK